MGRLAGMDAQSAAAVTTLLNTRGLTELVILHIGLTTGLIGPDLYSLLGGDGAGDHRDDRASAAFARSVLLRSPTGKQSPSP
ncbi:hypothetical protein [Nocardia sp. NPDC057440]|uniref:hypothetical protein n=1 Tax=Nocardia sp. NPDC057440 TaxID=3346134 RepID=UPI00366F132F